MILKFDPEFIHAGTYKTKISMRNIFFYQVLLLILGNTVEGTDLWVWCHGSGSVICSAQVVAALSSVGIVKKKKEKKTEGPTLMEW